MADTAGAGHEVGTGASAEDLEARCRKADASNVQLRKSLALYKEKAVNIASLVTRYQQLAEQHAAAGVKLKESQAASKALKKQLAAAQKHAGASDSAEARVRLKRAKDAHEALEVHTADVKRELVATKKEVARVRMEGESAAAERDALALEAGQGRTVALHAAQEVAELKAEVVDLRSEVGQLRGQLETVTQQQAALPAAQGSGPRATAEPFHHVPGDRLAALEAQMAAWRATFQSLGSVMQPQASPHASLAPAYLPPVLAPRGLSAAHAFALAPQQPAHAGSCHNSTEPRAQQPASPATTEACPAGSDESGADFAHARERRAALGGAAAEGGARLGSTAGAQPRLSLTDASTCDDDSREPRLAPLMPRTRSTLDGALDSADSDWERAVGGGAARPPANGTATTARPGRALGRKRGLQGPQLDLARSAKAPRTGADDDSDGPAPARGPDAGAELAATAAARQEQRARARGAGGFGAGLAMMQPGKSKHTLQVVEQAEGVRYPRRTPAPAARPQGRMPTAQRLDLSTGRGVSTALKKTSWFVESADAQRNAEPLRGQEDDIAQLLAASAAPLASSQLPPCVSSPLRAATPVPAGQGAQEGAALGAGEPCARQVADSLAAEDDERTEAALAEENGDIARGESQAAGGDTVDGFGSSISCCISGGDDTVPQSQVTPVPATPATSSSSADSSSDSGSSSSSSGASENSGGADDDDDDDSAGRAPPAPDCLHWSCCPALQSQVRAVLDAVPAAGERPSSQSDSHLLEHLLGASPGEHIAVAGRMHAAALAGQRTRSGIAAMLQGSVTSAYTRPGSAEAQQQPDGAAEELHALLGAAVHDSDVLDAWREASATEADPLVHIARTCALLPSFLPGVHAARLSSALQLTYALAAVQHAGCADATAGAALAGDEGPACVWSSAQLQARERLQAELEGQFPAASAHAWGAVCAAAAVSALVHSIPSPGSAPADPCDLHDPAARVTGGALQLCASASAAAAVALGAVIAAPAALAGASVSDASARVQLASTWATQDMISATSGAAAGTVTTDVAPSTAMLSAVLYTIAQHAHTSEGDDTAVFAGECLQHLGSALWQWPTRAARIDAPALVAAAVCRTLHSVATRSGAAWGGKGSAGDGDAEDHDGGPGAGGMMGGARHRAMQAWFADTLSACDLAVRVQGWQWALDVLLHKHLWPQLLALQVAGGADGMTLTRQACEHTIAALLRLSGGSPVAQTAAQGLRDALSFM